MSVHDIRLARWLKSKGFAHPYRLVRAARKERVRVSSACALVQNETNTGANIWGHDHDAHGCIWPCGGAVTRTNFRTYKARRKQGLGMQGCGPVQLTYYTLQDEADALGGCWHPYHSMRVGFRQLRRLKAAKGSLRAAYRAYNGSGVAAERYADLAIARRAAWDQRIKQAGFRA